MFKSYLISQQIVYSIAKLVHDFLIQMQVLMLVMLKEYSYGFNHKRKESPSD